LQSWPITILVLSEKFDQKAKEDEPEEKEEAAQPGEIQREFDELNEIAAGRSQGASRQSDESVHSSNCNENEDTKMLESFFFLEKDDCFRNAKTVVSKETNSDNAKDVRAPQDDKADHDEEEEVKMHAPTFLSYVQDSDWEQAHEDSDQNDDMNSFIEIKHDEVGYPEPVQNQPEEHVFVYEEQDVLDADDDHYKNREQDQIDEAEKEQLYKLFKNEVEHEQESDYSEFAIAEENKLDEKANPAGQQKCRKLMQSVFKPTYASRILKSVEDEMPAQTGLSFVALKLSTSLFGLNEEQADQLMRVDETHAELSNQDVILAKPGTVVKKCWRVKNLGLREWPRDTKIVSVTKKLYFDSPELNLFLNPGEVMDIGVKVFVPDDEQDDGAIKEYIMRLYWNEYKWFGEPLIVTCQLDTQLYNTEVMHLPEDSSEKLYPRVTDNARYLENYRSAYELWIQHGESFRKTLRQLNMIEERKIAK